MKTKRSPLPNFLAFFFVGIIVGGATVFAFKQAPPKTASREAIDQLMAPVSIKEMVKGPDQDTEVRPTVRSEAEFVSDTMKSKEKWMEYVSKEAGVSFQYPEGLFHGPAYDGDGSSGMRFYVETKPRIPEDGVCDNTEDIGDVDVDCLIAAWPKNYQSFQMALQGADYDVNVYYDSVRLAQGIRSVGKEKFVVSVEKGINGACVLGYKKVTPSAHLVFSINICDDPKLDLSKWEGVTIDNTEQQKAQDILASKDLSESTKIKIEALEQVLATLKIE